MMILDMTKVPYMSSAGLRMLLSLYRQVTSQNGQIVWWDFRKKFATPCITGFLDFLRVAKRLIQD